MSFSAVRMVLWEKGERVVAESVGKVLESGGEAVFYR